MKAILLLAVVAVAFAAQPTFPNDWTATQEDALIVYQGDYTTSDNNYCCSTASNCQIQTEYEKGTHYYAYSLNKTRFDDSISGQVIVTDWALGKEMLVEGSPMTCKEYCPTEGYLEPGFLDPNATDLGTVKVDDKTLEKWQWKETIAGIIVMEICTVLVDQSSKPALPYSETDELTPFGQPIGTMNTKWTDFTAGTPDPSNFDVQGVSGCPMSQNCGNSARQMARLRYKDFNTWAKYKQGIMPTPRV